VIAFLTDDFEQCAIGRYCVVNCDSDDYRLFTNCVIRKLRVFNLEKNIIKSFKKSNH
jgi:hypothetical protein